MLVRLNTDFLKKDVDLIAKEIAQIEVKIANTQKNLQRFETLFQQNVTSEKEYDDLVSQLNELTTQRDAQRVKWGKKKLELAKKEDTEVDIRDGLKRKDMFNIICPNCMRSVLIQYI